MYQYEGFEWAITNDVVKAFVKLVKVTFASTIHLNGNSLHIKACQWMSILKWS